jgi:hypothetical protein
MRSYFGRARLARQAQDASEPVPTHDPVPSTPITGAPTPDEPADDLAQRVAVVERVIVALADDLLSVSHKRRDIAPGNASLDEYIRGLVERRP